ncbi:sporulation related domain protein [mine drainage metagenome]|uniref:Sporulation related domain protein n=1 Tax=mine drainage metagenome TaxID=410659 RepID=A0A1J5SS39_9ZZZZ
MIRFRTVFALLILANLVFFAWGQGYFGTRGNGREPQRLAEQLSPEKLRVTSTLVAAATPPAAAPPQACRQVDGLGAAEAERLRVQAGAQAPDLQLAAKTAERQPDGYWVLIPSLADRQAAEKKLAELKRLGVSDYSLMTAAGPNQFAISLGLFQSKQAADERLQTLAGRGVRSAQVQARVQTAVGVQLVIRGPADSLAHELPQLLTSFPAASVTDCPVER